MEPLAEKKKCLYFCEQIGTVVRLSHPVPPPARSVFIGLADVLKVVNGFDPGDIVESMELFSHKLVNRLSEI